MPIYVYYYLDNQDSDERLEIWQEISESPLEACPITDRPVKRHVGSVMPALFGKEHVLSDENVKGRGFVKYVKSGDGVYERAQGDDPEAPAQLNAKVIAENLDRLLDE
ncbi:MAG TPA: hypothetical protein PKA27_14615 [Fimbriimonadaceae bacterium]|nr:hypothetical protein [Fimbriimonadaceae bacterium]